MTYVQDSWAVPKDQSSHTPAWDPSSLTPRDPLARTPAWDPSSRTPHSSLGSPLPAASSVATLQEEPPQHVLLSSRLAGLELKVVSGGKDQQVTIANVDGCLRIRHKVYNTISNLDPKSVTPKYPNPTRDNGLLVVIRGDHCGKYVRRICHIPDDDGPKFIDVAVVIRLQGSVERLSDERLTLGVEDLCIAVETSKEKTFGNNFMTPLREARRR